MLTTPAISIRGLGKTYRIARVQERPVTMAEAVLRRLRHPRTSMAKDGFDALQDVSLDIPWGEAVGLIGRNGAGKSTLLKILTRITAPTRGRIVLGGRVGSLLEVGTGFHPELTGRENVYLNGTLLGMRRREIQRRFDEIVDFSGVERFLDTQVKRYSTGMYVRLAFAVAAHLETEILAVDEVLAVGDVEFQSKCLNKMRSVATEGHTVIFVSHQLQTVRSLCTSAVYLESGRLFQFGAVEDALDAYKASFLSPQAVIVEPDRRPGSGEVRFRSVVPLKDQYEAADCKQIAFQIPAAPSFGRYYVLGHLRNGSDELIAQFDSRLLGKWFDADRPVNYVLSIRHPWLQPGRYVVNLFISQQGLIDAWEQACAFDVLPVLPYPQNVSNEDMEGGTVFADFSYDPA